MAKWTHEQKEEDRIVAKSKPIAMNLTSMVSTSSSTEQSDYVKKSGDIQGTLLKNWSSTGKLEAKKYNRDAASSSQRWQKDAVLDVGTRKLVATEEDQKHLNFPADSISTRKLVASGNFETEGSDKNWPHNLQISTNRSSRSWDKDMVWVRWIKASRCEHSHMVCIPVCHSSSCSSSWYRLHREFAINQESIDQIFETVISSDSEVDH